MEAFNFLNLWKTSPVVAGDLIPPPEYDDEEAFFDLELLNYEHKQDLNLHKKIKLTSESNNEDYNKNSPKSTDYSRSPISFLRSPPTFFKFRRNKVSGSASTTPVLSRTNSSSSRKAPNGVVYKYLRLMKIKISGESESEDSPSRKGAVDGMRSPSLRIVCRRSGKSRGSALPAAAAYMPSLRSDSVVQRDGIQSAILHCKRSFNSSPTDLSVISVSEPVILENLSRFSIEQKKRINI